MRFADRPSWRFGYGNGNCSYLLAALFARDSAALAIPLAVDVPPLLAEEWLAGESPAGLAAIPATDLEAAAGQWLAWWRAQVGSLPPGGADVAERLSWLASRHAAVFDPPDFRSLAAMRELQAVARAAQQVHPRVPDRSGSFDYHLIRSVAERTAADFGVPIDAIDATAHVLDVQGSWWRVIGPGCVLCSPAATSNPAVATELLTAAFASRLRSAPGG
jgi:hypothetical protein